MSTEKKVKIAKNELFQFQTTLKAFDSNIRIEAELRLNEGVEVYYAYQSHRIFSAPGGGTRYFPGWGGAARPLIP